MIICNYMYVYWYWTLYKALHYLFFKYICIFNQFRYSECCISLYHTLSFRVCFISFHLILWTFPDLKPGLPLFTCIIVNAKIRGGFRILARVWRNYKYKGSGGGEKPQASKSSKGLPNLVKPQSARSTRGILPPPERL